jgi:Domain of unknown function (DUF397)
VLREGQASPEDFPGQAEGGWRPAHAGAVWRKSSYSTYNGNCVEITHIGCDCVGVRDSKDRGTGPVLLVGGSQWGAFLAGAKLGDFDLH